MAMQLHRKTTNREFLQKACLIAAPQIAIVLRRDQGSCVIDRIYAQRLRLV